VLRRALDEVGLGAVWFTTRVMTSQVAAEQLGFLGSLVLSGSKTLSLGLGWPSARLVRTR
jgi:hypothetical protein